MSEEFGLPAPGNGRFAAALGLALLWNLAAGEPPAALSVRAWMGLAARGLRRSARGSATIALAVPVTFAVAAWFAFAWLEPARPWLAFALSTWLLAGSIALVGIGRGSLAVLDALRAGTAAEARASLLAFAGPEAPPRERDELICSTVGAIARRTGEEFCAPLLAYVLFGLPGVFVDAGLRAAREVARPRLRVASVGPPEDDDSESSTPAVPEVPPTLAERVHGSWSFAPTHLATLALLAAARLLGEDAGRGWRAGALVLAQPAVRATELPAAALVGALGLAPCGGEGFAPNPDLAHATRPPSAERVQAAWRVACLAAAFWSALSAFTLWSAGGPLLELLRR